MAQASMERKATRIAVVVAVALLLIKLAAYRSTGSTAVFSDAMESLVNVVASLLAVWSVWMAHRPADRTHPYGHGKAEFVSAAIEGGLVVAAAGAVAVKCVNDFGAPEQPLQNIDWGLLLLASSLQGVDEIVKVDIAVAIATDAKKARPAGPEDAVEGEEDVILRQADGGQGACPRGPVQR